MKYIIILLCICCTTLSRAQDIVKVEYWIDNDPGFDSALVVTGISIQPDISNFTFAIPNNLSEGIHTLGIRSKDSNSKWSHTNLIPINISDSSHGTIAEVEYFWDVDSGFGNSYLDTLYNSPIANRMNDTLFAMVPMIGMGNHTLYVRSMDNRGRWSHTNYVQVTVNGTVSIEKLQAENGISIYPNPVTDFLNIVPVSKAKIQVMIYDLKGQLLIHRIIDQQTKIDMTLFSPGIYSVIFWTEKNQIYNTKIIRE